MAIWTQPLQLKENGNWKMVEYSDEDSTVFNELCECESGHSTIEEAKACAEPPTAEKVIKEYTKDEIIRALFDIECEKLDIDSDGLLLLFQLEFVKKCKDAELGK